MSRSPRISHNRLIRRQPSLPGERPGGPGPSASAGELEVLLDRMRLGDRDAAATFVTRYGNRIRRRVRGKLGSSMRRIFDSQEILSTVSRRLDLYIRDGRLRASCVEELWSLVFRLADHAVVDKARICSRLRRTEGADSAFAQDLLQKLQRAEQRRSSGAEVEIEVALDLFRNDEIDRQIFSMWLVGTPPRRVAALLDLSEAAERQRWHRIRGRLQTWIAGAQN